MSRAPHAADQRDGRWRVGMRARCARCSATVDGYVAEAPTYDEALTDANRLTDAEARDLGWRVTAHEDRCPACRR